MGLVEVAKTHQEREALAQQVTDILYREIHGREFKVSRVILFGSTATRTDVSGSDIDMLVTYGDIPTLERDELFHNLVISTLQKAGIPLGDNQSSPAENQGKVTLQTMPDLVYQNPDRFINPINFSAMFVVKNIKRTGREMKPPMGNRFRKLFAVIR